MPIVESMFVALARSASVGSSRRSRDERGRRLALACRRHRQSLGAAGAVFLARRPLRLARRFESDHPAALDVTRRAATLPTSPQARLEPARKLRWRHCLLVLACCSGGGRRHFVVAAEAGANAA